MDGFRPALDGTYDVADQLSRYLRARAADRFAATRAEKRALDSQAAFEARRERVRETVLSGIGGLPDRPADLAVETRGTVERDGFAVELLTFESRPDFHVTANCYAPEGDGPFPGVLFLCGHVDEAKADPLNQRACVELVSNGFVVLAVDPVAQGERAQYRDPETGGRVVGGGGGVFAHCYAGQQCLYAGTNLARWMVHDARCGLDVLEARADVDADRLGVTGTSGGGVQTQYLCLLDDRVAAAAPCCSVTTREEWLETGKCVDAEQLVYGAIAHGVDHDDFVAAMAPKPVCVGAATSDQYFPVEGLHEAVERVRTVYDLYDAAENVDLVVADEPHCSVYELGTGVFEWFCDVLGAGDYVPREDHPVADGTALRCTPEGSVRAAFPDERTVDDLLREYVAERFDAVDAPTGESDVLAGGGDGRDAESVRERVVDRFDLDRAAAELHPRYVRESESGGLRVRHLWFRTERGPDAAVAGVLVSDPDVPTRSPAVVCFEDGTDALPERSDDVAALAVDHGTAFAFDPRGVGAVGNREIPVPNWVEEYDGIYGTEFKLAYDALLLGDSLFGMRVFDVLRAVAFLRAETGCESVSLVGEGVGAYHALYAAVAADAVERVDLRGLGPSFRTLATNHEYSYDARLTVYDVLGDCDVPRLLAALDDRDLTVERTSDRADGERPS